MDLFDLAGLLAAWAVVSEGVSIALEALAILRVTGGWPGAEDAVRVLPLIEEQQLLGTIAATAGQESAGTPQASEELFRIGRILVMLGSLAFGQGDLRKARSAEVEALSIFRNMGNGRWEGLSLWYLAMFDAAEHRRREAARTYRESLLAFTGAGDSALVYKPLVGLAAIAAEIGRPNIAAWILGSADEQLRRFGSHLFPFDRPAHERAGELSLRELGEAQFTAAHEYGQTLDSRAWIRMADDIALATGKKRTRLPQTDVRAVGALTAREQDVLRLLVEGRSNPEIAHELFVGVGTAKTHVAHILAKLGVPTRAAAATHAVRQGLI